jgi:phosphoribosylanthranilate isomerase
MTNLLSAVKTCGLSTKESVDFAVNAGADYVGFVFFARSPRNISPEDAASIVEDVPRTVKKVAVLVDPDDDFIEEVIDYLEPDYLQLHGNESVERVQNIKHTFGMPIIKAISVASAEDVKRAAEYHAADMFLFDTKAPADATLPGGNGETFDWELLSNVTLDKPWFLAGGLTVQNVADAIKLTGARIVDASSSLESEAGVKDLQLMEQFIKAVKSV